MPDGPGQGSDTPLLNLVGHGAGPPVVLVHGVAGSHMVWSDLSPLLEPHFTVVAVDLLGYGHSPKPKTTYTPALHVEALRRTLAARGFAPPHDLIGLSMGANLVLEYARRWPDEVRELIGIGFPYYPDEAEARRALQHNAWIRLTLRHPAIAGVVTPATWAIGRHTAGLFRNASTLYSPPVAADALRASYGAFKSSLFNCMVYFRQDEALEAGATMRRLFIHGDDDQWAGPEAIEKPLARYPNTRVEVIEGPHNLVVAQPDETARLIIGHLSGSTPPPGAETAP